MSRYNAPSSESGLDLRGFRNPVEPLQRRCEWRLAELQANLVDKRRAVHKSEAALCQLQAHMQSLQRDSERLLSIRMDPLSLRRVLDSVMAAEQRIATAQREVHQQREELSVTQRACESLRKKSEGLEEVRQQALKQHTQDLSRLQMAQADRDWLSVRDGRAREAQEVKQP